MHITISFNSRSLSLSYLRSRCSRANRNTSRWLVEWPVGSLLPQCAWFIKPPLSPLCHHLRQTKVQLRWEWFISAPLWNPSRWGVEPRRLHIRKHAQGDPTTVRDYANLRAIRHLQLPYVVTWCFLDYKLRLTTDQGRGLASIHHACIFFKFLFANLRGLEPLFFSVWKCFYHSPQGNLTTCFTTIGSDNFFPMAFNRYHIP